MDFIKEREDFSYKSICFAFKKDKVIITNTTNTTKMVFNYEDKELNKIIVLLSNKHISNWIARQLVFKSKSASLSGLREDITNLIVLKGLT